MVKLIILVYVVGLVTSLVLLRGRSFKLAALSNAFPPLLWLFSFPVGRGPLTTAGYLIIFWLPFGSVAAALAFLFAKRLQLLLFWLSWVLNVAVFGCFIYVILFREFHTW